MLRVLTPDFVAPANFRYVRCGGARGAAEILDALSGIGFMESRWVRSGGIRCDAAAEELGKRRLDHS